MKPPVLRGSVLALPLLLMACTSEPKVTAAASGPATPRRECFFANDANSFSPVDENRVNVRVGAFDVYQLTLFAPCFDIDWSNRIALIARGGSNICTGPDSSEIISPTPLGTRRCQVKEVRRLTKADVAALPANQRP